MRDSSIRCLLVGIVLVLVFPVAPLSGQEVDLRRIDRRIAKEPKYRFQPHYVLLVFGPKAEHRSWLAVDGDGIEADSGRVLYLDRNGNGNLTDPGDRVELDATATAKMKMAEKSSHSGMNVFPLGRVAGVELIFHLWVRKKNYVPKDERMRRILGERQANHWENGTLWRIAAKGSAAQVGVLLTERPSDAQITHLDGPLTLALKRIMQERIEPWPKETLFDVYIGTPALAPRNCRYEMFSRLTLAEVPPDVHPKAVFEFYPKSPGRPSIVRQMDLSQRCCGDTFFAAFAVPLDAGTEPARVTLSCRSWPGHEVQSRTIEVPFETQRSQLAERAFVMFHGDRMGLEEATTALRKRGLAVTRGSDALTVDVAEEPLIAIKVTRGREVRDRAAALGAGNSQASSLSGDDACFELSFRDLDRVLQEKNTLEEIESALRNVTHGAIYHSWDKSLSVPN
jgi:hypothetical protein